jgi:hypothetical protein
MLVVFTLAGQPSCSRTVPETLPDTDPAPAQDLATTEPLPEAARGASPAAADAAPSGPPRDLFVEALDTTRTQIRNASLTPGTAVSRDIPLYVIEVAVDTDFMTYEGKMDLWVRNRSSANWTELHFHLYPNTPAIAGDLRCLKVTRVQVGNQPASGEDFVTHYAVHLPERLLPGAGAHVTLEFKGIVKRRAGNPSDPLASLVDQVSSFLDTENGDYGVFSYRSSTLLMSLWHPVLSAYDDDGWDTQHAGAIGDFAYFDAADYLATVTIDRSQTVVSSGVVLHSSPTQTVIAAAASRELTIGAGRLLQVLTSRPDSGRTVVNSYALPGEELTQKRVLDAAVASLAFFESSFGPYPYRELDLMAADLSSGIGGVEFPGMIAVARLLYVDPLVQLFPETAPVLQSRLMRESLDFVVAHEVAHQWWNAVVGSHSRKHPFVDEALANYSAVLFMEALHGKEAMDRHILLELKLPYQLSRFLGGADRPVDAATADFTDLLEYSAVVYAKGGLFLHEMQTLLARDRFLAALAQYYREFSFRVAQPQDLVAAFTAHADNGEAVASLAQHWLHESHGDADIGPFDPAVAVPLLLREAGLENETWLTKALSERGLWEAVKLAINIASGQPDWERGVDLDAISQWASSLLRSLLLDSLFPGN